MQLNLLVCHVIIVDSVLSKLSFIQSVMMLGFTAENEVLLDVSRDHAIIFLEPAQKSTTTAGLIWYLATIPYVICIIDDRKKRGRGK